MTSRTGGSEPTPQPIEEVSDAEPAARANVDVSSLTPDYVYDAMIALKKDYPEGLKWTNIGQIAFSESYFCDRFRRGYKDR